MNSKKSKKVASEEKFSTMKEWRERYFPNEEKIVEDRSKDRIYPWRCKPLPNLWPSIGGLDNADQEV